MEALTKLHLFILFLAAFLVLSPSHLFPQADKTFFQRPDASAIERNLFELVNQEREKTRLPLVILSSELSRLARSHSKDMAIHARLSHLSSSGKSYTERLVDWEFYFADAGENIAFSETFQAEYIHQRLMESPEHKKNILSPDFELVGIGVIYKKNQGYYITQDFMESLERKEDKAVKEIIQKKIDAARLCSFLPPLLYEEEASNFARIYSQRKAEKYPSTPIPDILGEIHLVSVATPSPDDTDSLFQKALDPLYEEGGLGVWFARNSDYPGGAYFITLILFPEIKYKNLEDEALSQIVLLTINKMRQRTGLTALKLDKKLSSEAKQKSLLATAQRESIATFPPRKRAISVITYVTKSLELLPVMLEERLENPMIKNIGIGILLGKTPKYPRGTFWVTIVIEDKTG